MRGPKIGVSVGVALGSVQSVTGTKASLRGSTPLSPTERPRALGSSTRAARDASSSRNVSAL